jgi:hypothetical protein
LREVWRRPWADNDAADRRAFAQACKHADPADIIEGARAWVAAIDDARYLPALAKWLDGHGWLKEPPKKRGGRTRGDRLPRTNGNRVDMFQVFANLANGGGDDVTFGGLS